MNHYRRLLHPVAAAVPRLPNGTNGTVGGAGFNDVPADVPLKATQRGKREGAGDMIRRYMERGR